MLFSALIMWVQGLFLKLNFGSLEVVFILRWTTWWLRRLDVALQITKGTWWARTCWKTTWIAEIGKARIITGGCFLVFSRCFCYNFSLQNKGVLWSLGIHKKITRYQIILGDFQYASTLSLWIILKLYVLYWVHILKSTFINLPTYLLNRICFWVAFFWITSRNIFRY